MISEGAYGEGKSTDSLGPGILRILVQLVNARAESWNRVNHTQTQQVHVHSSGAALWGVAPARLASGCPAAGEVRKSPLVIEQTQPGFQNILTIFPKLSFLHFSRHNGRRSVRDLLKLYPKASDLVGRSIVSTPRLADSFRVSSSEAHKWIRIVRFIELQTHVRQVIGVNGNTHRRSAGV